MSQPYVYLPELFVYRRAAARRRAEAFCDVPEDVFGIRVKPLTPATFSMLLATENRFITGGDLREADIRNYIWFHSPLHANCDVSTWRIRKRVALARLQFHLAQPHRRVLGLAQCPYLYTVALNMAAADIKRSVEASFADAPAAAGRPGKPLATTEAYFIHEFASAYRWDPERTRHTPLRQLVQLHRCIRAGRGEDFSDAGEERIWADYLRAKNAGAIARAKAADSQISNPEISNALAGATA